MTKNKVLLAASAAIYCFSFSEAFSLQMKVINMADQNMYLYARGKGNTTYHKEVIPHQSEQEILVDERKTGITGYYDVIASTTSGDPDWQLLGGTCADLHKDTVPTLIIDKGLKTHCTTAGK
jgi:hypothetical protein